MVVYSFYNPEEGKMETLKDHILTALEAFNAGSRLVKVGEKLNKNFYKILRYSIIFHDFGKILFNQYMYDPSKRLDFSGHEIISCYVTNVYLMKTPEAVHNFTDKDRKIIMLAVLFHHHPMKVMERLQRLRRMGNVIIDSKTFEIFYQEAKELEDIRPTSIKINVSINDIVREMNGPWGLIRELWKDIWMSSSSDVKKTFLLIIQGLVSADYSSAVKLRGVDSPEKKKFVETIDLFLKFYS